MLTYRDDLSLFALIASASLINVNIFLTSTLTRSRTSPSTASWRWTHCGAHLSTDYVSTLKNFYNVSYSLFPPFRFNHRHFLRLRRQTVLLLRLSPHFSLPVIFRQPVGLSAHFSSHIIPVTFATFPMSRFFTPHSIAPPPLHKSSVFLLIKLLPFRGHLPCTLHFYRSVAFNHSVALNHSDALNHSEALNHSVAFYDSAALLRSLPFHRPVLFRHPLPFSLPFLFRRPLYLPNISSLHLRHSATSVIPLPQQYRHLSNSATSVIPPPQ
jgi:hypothetical protein